MSYSDHAIIASAARRARTSPINTGWAEPPRGNTDSIRLSPLDPMHYNTLFGIAGAHFIRADYEEAVRWLEKGLAERPNAAWVYRFLTTAYANAGRIEDARWAASKLRAAYPSITISQIIQVVPALGKLSVYAGRLRKAGLSERGRLNHLADRIFPDKQAAGWFGRTRCLGGAGL